jgi:hypothetical protein
VLRHLAFGLFAFVCLLAVGWPGYELFGNQIRPLVLGLPFSIVWNLIWVTLSFVALLVYDLTRPGPEVPARRAEK